MLEVIYLVFNEGYSATAGDDWMRPALCDEALRLGRILAELAPDGARGARPGRADGDPGVARCARAPTPKGEPVLLLDQDRARWDQLLIRRGLAALGARRSARRRARPLRAAGRDRRLPRARARSADATDWPRIAALYDALAAGRAVADRRAEPRRRGRMAFGPAAGLELVDALRAEPALASYHLLPSVRGDLLAKLGRRAEAGAEFERAAGMTRNERERALLLERARAAASGIRTEH